MGRHIRVVLAKCDLCQRAKHPSKYLEGPTQYVSCTRPRERLSVDLFGPLVKSQFGYQYVFVIMDTFTKYVKLYPMRAATGRGCMKIVLEKYINIRLRSGQSQ